MYWEGHGKQQTPTFGKEFAIAQRSWNNLTHGGLEMAAGLLGHVLQGLLSNTLLQELGQIQPQNKGSEKNSIWWNASPKGKFELRQAYDVLCGDLIKKKNKWNEKRFGNLKDQVEHHFVFGSLDMDV
ncbi:hypothetical protein M9H77_34044 [Catharanthus roseus]|uniref:Uncharacterized protein n=1 Tax=Catharanthus roseus TaxID=4058 RepID=A0ACB9ZKY1_CATRO|nr:hypothetical protein M9H77_34044 [Catharanthus roseus]